MSKALYEIKRDLVALMENDIHNAAERMASGNCNTLEEYKKATGRILGVRDAIQIVEDYFRRLNDDDGE